MSKFLCTFIFLFTILTNLQAQENPLAHCDDVIGGDHSVYNCKINVMDDIIEEKFGIEALKQAKKEAKEKCQSAGKSSKIDPKLRFLIRLDCNLISRIEFFDKQAQ